MNEHLTEDEIGRFIEKSCGEIDAARIYVHLCSCKDCFADYQFAARWRGVWVTDQNAFRSSGETTAAGEALASRKTGPTGRWRRFAAAVTKRRRPILAFAPAGIAVLAVGWLWLRNDSDSLPQKVIEPIRAAAIEFTNRGEVAIPGVEKSIDTDATPYRANYVAGNDSLAESLDYLVKKFSGGEIPRKASRWLITGFLAAGQLDRAKDYARDALELYPGDKDIATLAALAAYRRGDLDESERLLRGVVDRDRKYLHGLFNLYVILMAQDEREAALEIFADLERLHPRSPLTLRAKNLLEFHPSDRAFEKLD